MAEQNLVQMELDRQDQVHLASIKGKLLQAQAGESEEIHGAMPAVKSVYLTDIEISILLWKLK